MVKVRTPQDSGIYNGYIRSVLEEDPETYVFRWKKNAMEIIEEEASRMHGFTYSFKKEWDFKRINEEDILDAWKMKMQESMELTRDLIDCISNQVIKSIDHGSDLKGCKDDLSHIKEERYSLWKPQGNKNDFKKIWKLLQSGGDGKDFDWDAIVIHLKKMKKNEYFRSWFRRQLKNRRPKPHVICYTHSDADDIFCDWNLGCRPFDDDVDINKAFWNISLESKRVRNLSEEIGDLPICDRPDVIHDRCEILEGFIVTSKFVSTSIAYWNIFRSWKHIFQEKVLRKKIPSRRCHSKKWKKLLLSTQIETYFEDWKYNLKDDFFYEDLDSCGNSLFLRSSINVAQKLCLAFSHYKKNLKRIKQENSTEESLFKGIPYLRKSFEDSHSEFCTLRHIIRIERQRTRSFSSIMNEEDWLSDWGWNFSESLCQDGLPHTSLEYFQDWLHNFSGELEESIISNENELDNLTKKRLAKIKIEKTLHKMYGTESIPRFVFNNKCNSNHLCVEKMQRRKMNRMLAKQPVQRIFCH
uniref:Uncharacterized protein n=1 Tax=Lepeophtheirus salmonis TaxID=72036 RepID=A0A0K2UBK4_LEPSM